MRRLAISLMAVAVCLALAASSAWAAPLGPGDVKVEGMKLTIVPLRQAVEIEPLTLKSYEYDGELKAGTPGWRGPLLLPGPAWAFGALRPDSLVVTPADDPRTQLVKGKDYALDTGWAAVAAVEGSKYPPGTKVHFQYQYGLSRLDLIERTPEGKVVVTKGTEDKNQPHLPEPTPGNTPLAGVYLPNYATKLVPQMVNLIDADYDGVPPVVGSQLLKGVRAKLQGGKPTTIAFLGDSITAQQPKDFRDGKGSFVDRFTAYMKDKHPQAEVVVTPRDEVVSAKEGQIVIVKAGVGGDDTPRGLKRLDTDVLAHKPDLVIVMFGVNDENRSRSGGNSVPVAAYKANLATIVDKVRAAGGESLIMATSMKNLGWSGTVGNLDEYAAAARQVAKQKQVCLVDNFRAWELLPKRGYNYMVYLGNCINHPVDLGHELFFQGLKKAFESE